MADARAHEKPGVRAAVRHIERFDFQNLPDISFALQFEPGFSGKIDLYAPCHDRIVLDGRRRFPVSVKSVGGIRRSQNFEI